MNSNNSKGKPMIKTILLFAFLAFAMNTANAQNPKYDKHLADSLGADQNGMKNYILVILKTGTYDEKNTIRKDSLFRGHFANIKRLADNGKLVVAGPIRKNDKTYRGIFILNVATKEEAELLLQDDPTIKEKIFELEMYDWYGSAALPMYLDFHKKIDKNNK